MENKQKTSNEAHSELLQQCNVISRLKNLKNQLNNENNN